MPEFTHILYNSNVELIDSYYCRKNFSTYKEDCFGIIISEDCGPNREDFKLECKNMNYAFWKKYKV